MTHSSSVTAVPANCVWLPCTNIGLRDETHPGLMYDGCREAIAKELGVDVSSLELSMGMSGDFEQAVRAAASTLLYVLILVSQMSLHDTCTIIGLASEHHTRHGASELCGHFTQPSRRVNTLHLTLHHAD